MDEYLAVAQLICPSFDPSRSDAWRDLVGAMCSDPIIRARLNQLERPKEKGAPKKPDRMPKLPAAYYRWKPVKGTRKNANAFREYLKAKGDKRTLKTLQNALARRRTFRRRSWSARRCFARYPWLMADLIRKFSTPK